MTHPGTTDGSSVIFLSCSISKDVLSSLAVIQHGEYAIMTKLFNWNFHPLKLRLADAIHNFKGVKIIQI